MTRISLVTGASRGLGRSTALNIARLGGDVILTYRSRSEDAEAVEGCEEFLGCGGKAGSEGCGHTLLWLFSPRLQSPNAFGYRNGCWRLGSVLPPYPTDAGVAQG